MGELELDRVLLLGVLDEESVAHFDLNPFPYFGRDRNLIVAGDLGSSHIARLCLLGLLEIRKLSTSFPLSVHV